MDSSQTCLIGPQFMSFRARKQFNMLFSLNFIQFIWFLSVNYPQMTNKCPVSHPIFPAVCSSWARYSPIGLTFRGNWVVDTAKTTRRLSCLAEFETPLKSNPDFDFDVAFSTGHLKSSKCLYALTTYTKTFLLFYFGQLQSVSLTIWPFHFRVADISCYIKIPRRFWNSVNGDYKTHSHSK